MTLTKIHFTPSGTGATVRTIDSKLDEVIRFKDFGAVGDGTTDDATALLAALNAATGKVLDGGGLTYKCNSMLAPTSENIVVQNATFDFSGVTTTGATGYILFEGSVGTATAVSAYINGVKADWVDGGTVEQWEIDTMEYISEIHN